MAKAASNPDDFILPDLGEGVHEAELIKWRVEVGQTVAEHEILAEMETDKALVEVPSPRAGTIATLHGSNGEILHVGNPLVSYVPAAGTARGVEARPAESKTNGKARGARPAEPASRPADEAPDEPGAEREDAGTVVGNMSGPAAGVSAAPGKALATPAVRRLARDLGVDIDACRGTGIGGRVVDKDVRGSAGGSVAAAPTAGRAGAARATSSGGTASAGSGGDVAPVDSEEPHSSLAGDARPMPARMKSGATGSRPAPSPGGRAGTGEIPEDQTRIPFRGVRRTIANRLRESVNQAVHFTVMDEADTTGLDVLRRKLGAASGEKVSFLPFVAAAVCRVLQDPRFRSLNSTTDDKVEEIIQHRSVHLGIATDTDNGLMVPVIRDTDRLGVLEIGRAIGMIAEMARNRSIPREQLVGSTFTISNVGSHAGRFATPIINYPEVGILAVGRGREGMIVSKGTFRVGLLLPLSLACDHRVVDGATAALALARIIELLQSPDELLAPARG